MRAAGRQPKAKEPALWFEASLLVVAAAVDFVVGDPWGWPHPVQAMGLVIDRYCRIAIARSLPPLGMRILGIGLAALLIGGTAALSAYGLALLGQLWLPLRWSVETVLLASCFAGRSLRRAAEEVLAPLANASEQGPTAELGPADTAWLNKARKQLSLYVGRDTQQLSALEIRRAVMETVSENAIDGVLAPLFYAIVGALFGVAVPVALAYKAASTLDSMVGYKEAPYTDLGWFSARIEDGLTWLPCRLSVLCVAVLSGRPIRVLQICWRDARADPSPNAGWSECAYAAALGVQLGGKNTYRGQVKIKPLLGDKQQQITDTVIVSALQLTRRCFLLGLGTGLSLCYLKATLFT